MNDMELAEEIERHLAPDAVYHDWQPSMADMEQIIAALRRGHECPPSGEMVMVRSVTCDCGYPYSPCPGAKLLRNCRLSAAEAGGRKS